MFTIYPQLANRLKNKIAGLRTIDFDKGQLANPEQAYPINYPAVLIDIGTTNWKDLQQKLQRGEMAIGVTVAINPLHQSHQSSPTLLGYVQQMDIVNEVYQVLAGYKGGDDITIDEVTVGGASFAGLSRIATEKQKRWDAIQSYTHIFKTSFTDRSAQPVYTKVEVPIDVSAVLE